MLSKYFSSMKHPLNHVELNILLMIVPFQDKLI
ncbi:hypothetical protein NEOC65_001342 [Neochlamydia sp. AcF65]|nr:hypothetical protein [Neochlamydia sp. AcF65]MBS4170136.1 hypothetical protein [Neochlamydia sp. AcF95]